ncbi:lipocalin family protein [Flavivirga eckloniae]|uniref:Lipocalin-like domain-containing protein n=1 Tax=Flavivirga eckloniae TaxID=1803846 RepID=A0A2K9PRT8_9FLAO|nr:lipocalin family protein [Flavivirga eckloniae]AUP79759.1 hypothetical protein C1H87_14020 [Flavivirga eckloniae]
MSKFKTYSVIIIVSFFIMSCSSDDVDAVEVSIVGTWKVQSTFLDGRSVISQVSKVEFTENNKVTFFFLDFPTIDTPEPRTAEWNKNEDFLTIYWSAIDSNFDDTVYEIIKLTESTLKWKVVNSDSLEENQTLIK